MTDRQTAALEAVPMDGAQIRPPAGQRDFRALGPEEIERMEQAGCRADDWSRVEVSQGFDAAFIHHVEFRGRVRIGRTGSQCEATGGLIVSAGVSDSLISECDLADDVFVQRVGVLHRMEVAEGAVIARCHAVTQRGRSVFGQGQSLDIAPGSGGRSVPIHATLTLDAATTVCASAADSGFLQRYGDAVASHAAAVGSETGYIGAGARVTNAGRLQNVLIGAGAVIDGATAVSEAVLWSTPDEPVRIGDGAIVRNSLVQPGCHVDSGAVVECALLCEHSHASRHAKIEGSIIGPNSGVSGGEVSSSLVGPFVGFHHQALLIAAFWPEGKGNIGYGANVGSNHTGKAPDQEIWCGEGTFFGLGVNIKMPAHFACAPYTLIATGVDTLPQRMEMPFSLINVPSVSRANVPPAYNEVFPGWGLAANLYAVRRNEAKYVRRNRARRHRFPSETFRAETVRMIGDALEGLMRLEGRPWYTDRHLRGIGKNVLTEQARLDGIDAYTTTLRWYALRAAFRRIEEGLSPDPNASGDAEWESARPWLASLLTVFEPSVLLRRYLAEEERIASAVEASKAKDDGRGVRTIDDYAAVHGTAADDPFVVETWAAYYALRRQVEALLDP